MITITILIVFWFIYSVYKIKQTCGRWNKFDPYMAPYFPHLGFYFGMMMLGIGIIHMIVLGIIP
jgi:hypothetical protein